MVLVGSGAKGSPEVTGGSLTMQALRSWFEHPQPGFVHGSRFRTRVSMRRCPPIRQRADERSTAQLVGSGLVQSDKLTAYTFSGPRTGNPVFAAKFNQTVAKAWRAFNTEDLVPTLPLSTIDSDPKSLRLLDTNIELVLKLFFKPSPFLFQHVDSPVALTYQLNTVADNHNLTQLYSRLG